MDPQRIVSSHNDNYRQRHARSLEVTAQQKFGKQSSFVEDDFFSNYGNYELATPQNRIPPSVMRRKEFHPTLLRVGSSAERKDSSTTIRTNYFEPAESTTTTMRKMDVERQCRGLWNLRAALEHDRRNSATNNDGEGDEDTVLLDSSNCYYKDLNDDGGGTTSYATSFESNTEPSAFDDYAKPTNTAPLGSYLVPPRLSLEDRRAKLKGLYAKRQMWSQETGGGASIESYEESFETNGTPDLTNATEQNSFESNQASDSTTDTKRKVFQKDSGFKSQSMGESEPAVIVAAKRPPIIAKKVTSFDSSTSYPDFEASLTNSDSDVGDTNRSSDKYRTIIHQSLNPTHPKNFRSRIFSVPDRDYAVDTYSDSIFRQFSKIDPEYESPSPRSKLHHSSKIKNRNADVIGNREHNLSQEDSMEENHDTALFSKDNAGRAFLPLVTKNDAVVLG
uniref:Uncharacterized protein n=1 Tax=Romanomermis culicivorax TaxID=13658 RepID=A0A915IEV8_ROMCU